MRRLNRNRPALGVGRFGRRRAPTASLAAYYGTGLGQVPLHLAPENAVLDAAGNVISVANKGGAEAAFAASASGAIKVQDRKFSVPAGPNYLTLASPANLCGARLFMVASLADGLERVRIIDFAGKVTTPTQTALNLSTDGSLNAVINPGTGWVSHRSSPVTLGTSLHLIEIEISAGQARYWVDGVSAGSTAFAFADYPVDRLFRQGSNNSFVGQAGDIVSMVTDGSAAMDDRAAEIRWVLAQKHGLTVEGAKPPAPPAPPKLSDFYGTGIGQIPGDWRIDDPVLSGTSVTSVRNDGGAGAAFALSQAGASALPTQDGLFMRTNGSQRLQLANAADMVGTHFMSVLHPTSTAVAALLWQGNDPAESYYEARTGMFVLRDAGGNVLAAASYPALTGPVLYEMRWTGTSLALIINGVLVNTVATTATAAWPAKVVAGGKGSGRSYVGLIGRCVSVVIDPAKSAEDPEQAVLVARQTLAAQYGITLA